MSTSLQGADDLINRGVITINESERNSGGGGRTFIVTGLHRSGTSLIAAVLRRVGIFMGAEINDVVHEDETIARLLIAGDSVGLAGLIAERDATYGTWGFKFPALHQSLAAGDIARFRNPHLIVPFRDPVSVGVRTALAEYRTAIAALRDAVDEQAALVRFIDSVGCPALLLSYEKSIVFPADFIEAIIAFCGLPRGDGLRESLMRLIEPNRQSYIAQARRTYDGMVDAVDDGVLHGWCRLTSMDDPVMLEILADDRVLTRCVADRFRQDLRDAGFGAGHHAFAVDLGGFRLRPDAIVRVRVDKHGVELGNSGKALAEYGG
jgi:hypothetical protein